MILAAMAAGACVAAGLLVGARAFAAPVAPNLGRRLAAIYEPLPDDPFDQLRRRWQSWALSALRAAGTDVTSLRQDLAVTGITLERHAIVKLGGALAGAATPLAVGVIWRAININLPPTALALLALIGAVTGFFVPDLLLARAAAARRRDFRYALGLFLELVVIVLAGGGGVQSAVHDAANAGNGWAFLELRRALHSARLQRLSPWKALAQLAERIGSGELRDLAASVELAGTEGARVRDSLLAKAQSVREHELAEAESEALAASERMGGPMMGMFVGLVLIIGYPAVATLLSL